MTYQRLTLAEFEAAATEYDHAVDQTGDLGSADFPEIDIACSSTDWLVPSFAVWANEADPWILQSPAGFVVLSQATGPDGNNVLVPPESMWGFASPIIGSQPEILAHHLLDALNADPSWDLLLLTGLAPDGRIENAVRRTLHEHYPIYSGPGMTRCRIDIPTFRSIETSKQRRERRRVARRCAEQDVEVIDPLSDETTMKETIKDTIFRRVLQVEAQSWKGLEGSGIIEPTLQEFYRAMIDRLPVERLRVLFAQLDGEDIGYIIGHTRGDEYRGLQISYADHYRHLSIGSLLQSAEIARAEASGVETYDLGMDMEYKQQWATHTFTTRTTAIARTADLLGGA